MFQWRSISRYSCLVLCIYAVTEENKQVNQIPRNDSNIRL